MLLKQLEEMKIGAAGKLLQGEPEQAIKTTLISFRLHYAYFVYIFFSSFKVKDNYLYICIILF